MSGDNFGFKSSGGGHNRKNKFGGGGLRPDHTAYKRSEAKERLDVWRKLTPAEQLASLDGRLDPTGKPFGKGMGSTKQRARIQSLIDAAAKAQPLQKEAAIASTGTGDRIKAKDRRAAEQAKRPSK